MTLILMLGSRAYSQSITISSGSGDTVCYGTSVTFTASVTGSATYGYIWRVNGGAVGPDASAYTTTSLMNGDAISCTLTNAAGDTILGVSDTIHMTIDSLPRISLIAGPNAVCVGDTIQLMDSVSGGVWSTTNPMSATVNATGVVTGIAPAGGGGFGGPPLRIVYKMTNSCGTDSVRYRINVNVPAGPITGTNVLCIDSTTFLRDTARGGMWTSSDSTIAGFIVPFGIVQGFVAGTVTITYNLVNACGTYSDTMSLTVINCDTTSGVASVASLSQGLNIYPNPSNGTFTIKVVSGKYSQVNCTITNMVGESVSDFVMDANKEKGIEMTVPTGIYFVTIAAGNEKYTSKITVIQ